MKQKKQAITITDKAADQIRKLIAQRQMPSFGIRIGVRSGGCSGFKYVLDYADSKNQYDEVIQHDDIVILIDPKALMYVIGTEMDYTEEQFKSGFVFINPNEKGKCGCGSSFSV